MFLKKYIKIKWSTQALKKSRTRCKKTGLHYKSVIIIFFSQCEYKLWIEVSNRHRCNGWFLQDILNNIYPWKYVFQQFKKQKSQSSHSFRAKILNLQLKFLAFLSHWKTLLISWSLFKKHMEFQILVRLCWCQLFHWKELRAVQNVSDMHLICGLVAVF